jgi:hypothetical protein
VTDACHRNELRVSTRDDEHHVREVHLLDEPVRHDVAFDVVHADERLAETDGESFGGGKPDEQRAEKPRARGRCNAVHIIGLDAGALEGGVHHRQDVLEVLARGDLGDHASVLAMRQLRRDDVREHFPAITQHRGGGVVTRGFDPQNEHVRGPPEGGYCQRPPAAVPRSARRRKLLR